MDGSDMKHQAVLAVAALVAITGLAHASEYLQNGGFETGDLTGWNLVGNPGSTFVEPTTFGYLGGGGNYYVYAGPPSSSPGILSQTFLDVAGELLTVSGSAIGDTFNLPDNLGEVSYYFDGILLGSPDLSGGSWTESTYHVTATGSDTFSINYANDRSYNGLDNFSVTNNIPTIPEPSTWVLAILGFIGIGSFVKTFRIALGCASR
jgi:hypothetical protein